MSAAVARAVGFLLARLTPAALVCVFAGWRFALAFLVGQVFGGEGFRVRLPHGPVYLSPPRGPVNFAPRWRP